MQYIQSNYTVTLFQSKTLTFLINLTYRRSYMNSKEALKLSCKERGVKDIAENLSISPTAIYNQINDSDKSDI